MVKENIQKIRKTILEKFPDFKNKFGEHIVIVAASKNQSVENLQDLKSLGIDICGENRVQEFLEKYGKAETKWHFIGNLQTNKVKYIVDKVDLIQSCNSERLAAQISSQSIKKGIVSNILLEVNVANEESKHGVNLNSFEQLFEYSKNLKSLKILGLMAMMPLVKNIEQNTELYLQMRALYDKIRATYNSFKYLSMGMSNDYMLALKCGANMIRLGGAIFKN